MSDEREEIRYAVGYGKPPVAGQFTAGRSGNPKGRPKGSKNFATLIAEAMNVKLRVKENGKSKRVTKKEAMAISLANKAALGDPRAAGMIIPLLEGDKKARPSASSEVTEETDRKVVTDFLARSKKLEPKE